MEQAMFEEKCQRCGKIIEFPSETHPYCKKCYKMIIECWQDEKFREDFFKR